MDYPPPGSEFLPERYSWLPPPLPNSGPPTTEHSQWQPLLSYDQPRHAHCPMMQVYGDIAVDYNNSFAASQTLLSVNPNANDIVVQSQQLAISNGTSNIDVQPITPRPNSRKRKAPTLRADDWEPVKARVIELYIDRERPLPEVKEVVEQEFNSIGFTATIRQYQLRLSQWCRDKNVKPNEMKAIVRKRQQRKLVEMHKGELIFQLRGSVVEPGKINRWMKRNNIPEDAVYVPSPAAATPAALSAWTISECGSPAPSPAAFGEDWELSPTTFSTQDTTMTVVERASSMPLGWATTYRFMPQDLPWFQFHSLLFSFDNSVFANSPTYDALKARFPDHPVQEDNGLDSKNRPESIDIITTVRKQRGGSFNLEEVMPECFQIHVSLSSQMQSTLSARSSITQLAETGLFLAANNLLNGSSLADLVKKTLGTANGQFFKQLFKLQSSTVQSFTCRLLESLSSRGPWSDASGLLWRLVRCGLDRSIIAGPTGGRCLQLAIWNQNVRLALALIKNGVQQDPKLGSKEPFNQTPVELAELRKQGDVLDALLGGPSDHPKPSPPQPVRLERTEGEVALEKAIEANDIEKICSLLIDGLDIDSARTRWDEPLLEWTFFEKRTCYDIILPYSRASDHLWTVPGIISASITSEKLEVYLHGKMGKGNGEIEDEEEIYGYEIERCDVLQRSVELAMANHRIHEVQTILSLEWVRGYLDLEYLLLEAAMAINLDLMVKLVAYGADFMALDVVDSEIINECMANILADGVQTGCLQKLLKIRWFSLEDIFEENLRQTTESVTCFNVVGNTRILIDHGLDLDSAIWQKESDEWHTPLQLAVRWDSLQVVKCLIDAGADVNNTPEECSYTTLGEAVRAADIEIIQYLIREGADVEKFANNRDVTLVELAVDREEYDIFETLLKGGASINGPIHRKQANSWNTALTRAISGSRGHEIIYHALDAGADINQMGGGTGALTPLQAAAQKSEINIARELLRRGACINAPAAPDHGRTALQAACEGGRRSEEMISLLLEEGADFLAPPAPRYGRTALQALCCSENPSSELVAFLIDRGADINAPAADCGGLTALQGAALVGNIKIAVLLMEKGANVNALPSRQEGRMALDGAAEYGRLDTVQLLLTLGATCTVPGGSGYDSAVNFAEDNGHFAIVDMLRSRNKQSEGELFDVNMC